MKASLLSIIALAAAGNSVFAQSTTPQCVRDCATQNPSSSFCDGDETGIALSNCTCQSLQNSNLLKCIKAKCPSDAQLTYAQNLPKPCGSTLFPNLNLGTGGGSSSSASNGGSAATPTPSTSGGSNPATTAAGGATPTPTPTTTRPPSAADGLVAPGLVLAAGPLVAAVLL
ncbi:hypothetical protein Micbo1qcDRAFT_202431 [Microdochium bolleyi]|uniref:CFEM domain-containing protein n=1 Tax=Microdochium bolleyi TaxID=196109 RepID=A0A136JBN5_9PEZI|nr:hypothetical protein Micbo1qcDRAFT_202431 [Microdochium bolleyi]